MMYEIKELCYANQINESVGLFKTYPICFHDKREESLACMNSSQDF